MENRDMNLTTTAPISAPVQRASSGTSWFSGIVRGRSATANMSNNSSATSDDSSGGGVGPINKKHQFRGVMFKYGPKPIQVKQKSSVLD